MLQKKTKERRKKIEKIALSRKIANYVEVK